MAIFCGKHSNCLAPISVISEIIFKNEPVRCKDLCDQFNRLGLFQVKDLANSTFVELNKISVGSDTIHVLYGALKAYHEQCQKQLQNSTREYENNNIMVCIDECLNLLIHNPLDINILMLMAASYFQCKEYDQSIKCLLKVIELDPNCIDAFRNLGSNFYKKFNFDSALFGYYCAAAKSYTYNDCWNLYAKAYVLSQPGKEELLYKLILQYKPDLYMVRYEFANYLFLSNREEDALNQFRIVINDSPQFALTWNSLGCIYFKNHKEDAINYFTKALDQDQQLSDVWLNLGITNCLLGNYDSGIITFKRALEINPDNFSISHYLACSYLKQDNIDLAVDALKSYILVHPDNVDANYELALIYLYKLKNINEAIKYLEKCLELKLNTKDFYMNLFSIYIKLKKIKQASQMFIFMGEMYDIQKEDKSALHTFTCALIIDRSNAEAHWKLGLKLFQLGCFDIADYRFRMALNLRPNFPEVYCDLALLYEKTEMLEKASQYYNMALHLQPNYVTALHNLIRLGQKINLGENVIKLCYGFLRNDSSFSYDIHVELGNYYSAYDKHLDRSFYHYKCALNLDPSSINVYIKLGNLCLKWKKPYEARKYFKNAIALDPQSVIAHTQIGSIDEDQNKFKEAIESYKLALTIQSDFPDAFCNLMHCSTHICYWQNYDVHIERLKDMLNEEMNGLLPLMHPYNSLLYPLSSVMIKEIASKHAEKWNKIQNVAPSFKYPISLTPNGCIRVGYVSSDFGDHSASQITVLQSICNFHDSEKIEIFFYALSSNNLISWRNISRSVHLRDISKINDTDAALQINKDGIHILINMNGYTKGARNEIFALRPASIQVLWLGYPGTSGAAFIDYLITDKVCSPSEFNHHYTEKLAYMNRTVYIGDHKRLFGDLIPRNSGKNQNGPTRRRLKTTIVMNKGLPTIKILNLNDSMEFKNNIPTSIHSIKKFADGTSKFYTRSQYSLPEDAVVYCNFSKLYKIDPHTFNLWITILKDVPNSVLWLLKFPEVGVENLINTILTLDFDSSRIIFGDVVLKEEHMRRIQLADIFLDTCIYNGHKSCLDSLWAGVPIITLSGETFASRVAASQLITLGCTETIAQNKEQYLEIAVKFGKDKSLLANLRSEIWRLRTESKLFDCKSYTEELEVIYKDMWNNFLSENHLDVLVSN